MQKSLIFLAFLMFTIALAQPSTYPLPVSFQGEGTQQTAAFNTDAPWQVEITSNAVVLLYLYDPATGQNLGVVQNGQPISNIGTFFLYVSTAGSWQMTLSSLSSATTSQSTPEAPPSDNTTSSPAETMPTLAATASFPLKKFGFGTVRFARSVAASINTQVCESFPTALEVQTNFITSGGPDLDPYDLDPDGDGYACSYDPRESYDPPVECKGGKVWWNPRFRNKDGVYVEGNCRNP